MTANETPMVEKIAGSFGIDNAAIIPPPSTISQASSFSEAPPSLVSAHEGGYQYSNITD